MSKKVIIYARYSTDRQDEQSIETQVNLARTFAKERNWTVVGVYEDRAVSGTMLKMRPGIQDVLRAVKQGGVDVLLCLSVDRISRDMEHSSGILKQLRHKGVELWTVQNAQPVNDMELGLRSIISHDMIEQTRYKTREGMKTAVRKGKAAGGLAYGYKVKLAYDDRGERIPGLREPDPSQAPIVVWIFEQYALGRSPMEIAQELNKRDPLVPGPRGLRWRDTAIRGHVGRGAGILNNETYIGRYVFNRRRFSKNPDTEKREARANNQEEWVVQECPDLRIISDELWHKVKARQRQAAEEFDRTANNRLNRAHRPQYLFSGRIECGICGGPYAVMAKDRYGCTNRQKKLPIEHLNNESCSNSKTIARAELERRVLKAIPTRLFSVENTRSIIDEVNKEIERISRAQSVDREKLGKELAVISQKQQVIAEQITERLLNGHPDVKVFNDMLTRLEEQRIELERKLGEKPVATVGEPKQIAVNVSMLKSAFDAMTAVARHGNPADDVAAGQFNLLRELVQKVVVLPSSDGKTAELTVHGRLAAILASIKAVDEHTAQKRGAFHAEFTRRVKAREFRTTEEKLDFVTRFHASMAEAEAQWRRLQVSVVAGAGFEPAAFRL